MLKKLNFEYANIIRSFETEVVNSFGMSKELVILFFSYLLNLMIKSI